MSCLLNYIMIHFFSEEISFELANSTIISDWLIQVTQAEGQHIDEVNYIFCDDAYLHTMNVQYLSHDTLTDVITFQYESSGISGDIFISITRVRENAVQFKVPFDNELSRVMVHGLLHLLGYKDKSEQEQQTMRAKEDQYLDFLT